MPQISIIIPLYNKAPYLRKALGTVCAQTFRDWECIVVDDGSTDGSGAIIDQFAAEWQDPRLRVIHQTNAGVAVTRNRAAAEATGEYLCFLDADDWWEPTYLEEMYAFAKAYSDAGMWACNYIYYKPGKTRQGVSNLHYTSAPYINYPASYVQATGMPVWTGATMMLRSTFQEMGGFPEGIALGEDFLLWARIAMHHPVGFLDRPLAYYNNDIPASLRATRNLHAPSRHMLFNMEELESIAPTTPYAADWRILFDTLRIKGLLEYWQDTRYHAQAEAELLKVDWSQFPPSARKPYLTPIWWLKLKRRVMAWGSFCKQILYRSRRRK